MVSRDTAVHLSVVCLAFALLLAAQLVTSWLNVDLPLLLVAVVFNGLVFGGAHLYLAVRREDGLVPPESRWRYVAFFAVLLAIGVATALANGDRLVAGVELRAVAWSVAGVLIVAYLAAEARDGYRSSLEA